MNRPIGMEIHQTSYAWSSSYAKRFILVDYWIKNTSGRAIEDPCIGLETFPAVSNDLIRPGSIGQTIVGLLRTVPGTVPGTVETLNVAWAADNDGDPTRHSEFTYQCPTGALGVRVLRAPPGGFSFNWWIPTETGSWGPKPLGALSAAGPFGDLTRYRLMTNEEIDYDQVYSAVDYTSTGWSPPPKPELAKSIAGGAAPLFMLSYKLTFAVPAGDSIPFTIALVAGAGFHTDPQNYAARFNPLNPKSYLDHLDFSDLIKNSRWADWVFDSPGVDTDHDGYRGRAYLVNCSAIDTVAYDTVVTDTPPETVFVPITTSHGCDSIFWKGDGVPDFDGPQPPTPPQFTLTSQPGRVILRWDGPVTELEKDPITGKRDFEGYRVYAGRAAAEDQLSMIASWDKEDFKRLAYDALNKEWTQVSDPLSIDRWRIVLANPRFDPRDYSVPSFDRAYQDTVVDTSRNVEGKVISISRHERFSYWTPEAFNRSNTYWETDHRETNLIQQVGTTDTMIDGDRLTYGSYEITIENLVPSVPLYFAVSTFDFGDFNKNLGPLESSPANNFKYGQPIYSADVVKDSGIKVAVYPNPYRIAYNDAFGHRTNYFAEGYEGYGHPVMTEYDMRIHFINLPDTATIRIYSLAGDLIREIHHPDRFLTTYSSEVGWDLISRNAQPVVSGIYIYRVDSRLGSQVGKIVIIK
ncbi:MAG: T9SS type A sorting domain-containing protein [candidate division Zixibacteria bacterium]|nr:T9SS type A sorting domain-containing protein [candidate division Zixibacteria bacterium]